jgi:hypothetical protein
VVNVSFNHDVNCVDRKLGDLQRAKMKYTGGGNGGSKPPISARLSAKIGKCSAKYPRYLEKCCKYREQFYRNIEKCNERPKPEKRQCRRSVRRRYKVSNTKNRKSGGNRRKNRKNRRAGKEGRNKDGKANEETQDVWESRVYNERRNEKSSHN